MYIEPQLDELWWYSDYVEIQPGQVWKIAYENIFVDTKQTIKHAIHDCLKWP